MLATQARVREELERIQNSDADLERSQRLIREHHRKMLQLALDQASPNAQLVYMVDENVIQVTTQEDADKQMITKGCVVDDLVKNASK